MQHSFNKTFTYVKRLADHVSFGKIAQVCGKTTETAEAWGRAPESNINPSGTGKRNTFDCSLRLIGLAHKEDPALAREMADIFPAYVDFLEGKTSEVTASPNALVAQSIKEHSDAVVAVLNQEQPDFVKAHTEIVQAEVALLRLKNWVKAEMRMEVDREFDVIARR